MTIAYAAPSAFAITLVSLALDASRESIAIDNTTTKYDDAMVSLWVGSALPTVADQSAMYIWFYGSVDQTTYTEPTTGADAAITLPATHNLRGSFCVALSVGTMVCDVNITSVASYFGGNLPPKWGIVVENQCNGAFSGTEPSKFMVGIYYTSP